MNWMRRVWQKLSVGKKLLIGAGVAILMTLIWMVVEVHGLTICWPGTSCVSLIDHCDRDGDGWNNAECGGDDCDDDNRWVHPAMWEHWDGIDNDCDGVLAWQERDEDGDGFSPFKGDCDDTDPNVNPDAVEIFGNGIDDDCDGEEAGLCVVTVARKEESR